MIVTVTMNPAVDRSAVLGKLIPEKKLRCTHPLVDAGGGGINVSKAIKTLGGESLAIFPAGGANGKLLVSLLAAAHIRYEVVPQAAETRENFTVTERATNVQYRFVMPGGPVTETEINKCLLAVRNSYPIPQFIVASGSLPPGAPDDLYARMARQAKKDGIPFILDTSGVPLQLAAQEGVYLLKASLSELATLVNMQQLPPEAVEAAAKAVVKEKACEVLVVSMGPAGALLVTKDSCEHIPAPEVRKLSTVGAGDSMLGGMVWMLAQGNPLSASVRFGVACGSAATMNAGTHLFNSQDAFDLYDCMQAHPACLPG